MESLIIGPTESTPRIHFDPQNNIFEISGESRPENSRTFYEPVIDWVKKFSEEVKQTKKTDPISLKIQLEYFSSTSAKYLVNCLGFFESLLKENIDVNVIWRYRRGDTQIKEAGEQFQEIFTIPFVVEIFAD